jgi:hypothetical protein
MILHSELRRICVVNGAVSGEPVSPVFGGFPLFSEHNREESGAVNPA